MHEQIPFLEVSDELVVVRALVVQLQSFFKFPVGDPYRDALVFNQAVTCLGRLDFFTQELGVTESDKLQGHRTRLYIYKGLDRLAVLTDSVNDADNLQLAGIGLFDFQLEATLFVSLDCTVFMDDEIITQNAEAVHQVSVVFLGVVEEPGFGSADVLRAGDRHRLRQFLLNQLQITMLIYALNNIEFDVGPLFTAAISVNVLELFGIVDMSIMDVFDAALEVAAAFILFDEGHTHRRFTEITFRIDRCINVNQIRTVFQSLTVSQIAAEIKFDDLIRIVGGHAHSVSRYHDLFTRFVRLKCRSDKRFETAAGVERDVHSIDVGAVHMFHDQTFCTFLDQLVDLLVEFLLRHVAGLALGSRDHTVNLRANFQGA